MNVERKIKFCKSSDLAKEDDIVTIKEDTIKRMGTGKMQKTIFG